MDNEIGAKSNGRTAVLVVAAAGSFLMPLMLSSIIVALPTIGDEFDMSASGILWVSLSYQLSTAICLVPLGKLADIYGRKRLYIIGMSIYTVASLLSAVSPVAAMLIASRVLQGVGASMMLGTSTALVTEAYPPQERGRALGITVAAVYIGLTAGPFIGGVLTQHFGWRSLFYVNIPVGLFLAIFSWKMLGADEKKDSREPFDFTGSMVYSASLLALMLGMSKAQTIEGCGLMAAGAFGIVLFYIMETRSPHPVLDVKIMRGNRVFVFSSLAALINYSATFATGFVMSLYLTYVKKLEPQEVGLIIASQFVVQAVFSPIAGRLSDRIEPRIVATAGMAITAIGLAVLSQINGDSSIPFIVAALAVLGLGFAFFSSPNTAAVMGSVERKYYGVAAGFLGTMRITGQMMSAGIAMFVFALVMGVTKVTPEHHEGLVPSAQTIFMILAALCFGGVFASLSRGKIR
jgi:EmrB/QacA subfamily drug resistance transporter